MFRKLSANILSSDGIEALKGLDTVYLRALAVAGIITITVLWGVLKWQHFFASSPAAISPSQIGLPHVYGPVPLDAQLQQSYQFKGLHLKYGAFGAVELDRIGEVSKEQFQSLVLQNVPESLRERLRVYTPVALGFAQQYQVDPFWVLAVMWTESHFNPEAESHMNAQGLMQILPGTGAFIFELLGRPVGHVDRQLLRLPHINIEMGVFYLKRALDRFDGNYRYATAAYNMGTARILRRLRRGLPVGVNNHYLNKVSAAYTQLIAPFQAEVMARPREYERTYVAFPRLRESREVTFSSLLPTVTRASVPLSTQWEPNTMPTQSWAFLAFNRSG